MNIRDVKDAMDDLIKAHGCTEETIVMTGTYEPIIGFGTDDLGNVFVINSDNGIADDEVQMLRADNRRLREGIEYILYNLTLNEVKEELERLIAND